jgi:hypothetical protein
MEGGALVDENATYRAAEKRIEGMKKEIFFRDGIKEE